LLEIDAALAQVHGCCFRQRMVSVGRRDNEEMSAADEDLT
jgi:hypothetical protein